MSHYYDRDGNAISFDEWATLLEDRGLDYRRVAETILTDGKWISTVWVGLTHRYGGDGLPLIFETMVFPSVGIMTELELDCARYSTEAEAMAGHAHMVAKWQGKP